MAQIAKTHVADQGQRRASFQQARSHETKRSLVQAAMALWRANGYARTTVADICRAAGVSKALFYFYFPRKEDVLFEFGVLSTDAAHSVVTEMLAKPYEVPAVITAVLASLEDTMRRSTPELLIEAILRGLSTSACWPRPPGKDVPRSCGGVPARPTGRQAAERLRRGPRRECRTVDGERWGAALGSGHLRRPVFRRGRRPRHHRIGVATARHNRASAVPTATVTGIDGRLVLSGRDRHF